MKTDGNRNIIIIIIISSSTSSSIVSFILLNYFDYRPDSPVT